MSPANFQKNVTAYVVCTSMFPLCLGRVMSHRLALIFVWGIIFVDDLSYVPPDLTFFYGVISVAFVVGPLLLVLVRSHCQSVSPHLALATYRAGPKRGP